MVDAVASVFGKVAERLSGREGTDRVTKQRGRRGDKVTGDVEVEVREDTDREMEHRADKWWT